MNIVGFFVKVLWVFCESFVGFFVKVLWVFCESFLGMNIVGFGNEYC